MHLLSSIVRMPCAKTLLLAVLVIRRGTVCFVIIYFVRLICFSPPVPAHASPVHWVLPSMLARYRHEILPAQQAHAEKSIITIECTSRSSDDVYGRIDVPSRNKTLRGHELLLRNDFIERHGNRRLCSSRRARHIQPSATYLTYLAKAWRWQADRFSPLHQPTSSLMTSA
jgi:hypothetical protein